MASYAACEIYLILVLTAYFPAQRLAAVEAQHSAEAEQRRRAEEAAVAAVHRAREAAQRWEQAEQQATVAEGESAWDMTRCPVLCS